MLRTGVLAGAMQITDSGCLHACLPRRRRAPIDCHPATRLTGGGVAARMVSAFVSCSGQLVQASGKAPRLPTGWPANARRQCTRSALGIHLPS
ncbi:hypothetical protein F441_04602 [Phytophthora nicotianae CJ01A1]|uniref:Uncharacterized protein n=5 Tax=Phytophthora nicotianae TaxID=4792 RepID=W2QIC8_PHYN3|nr:hypothetical protein PPTG_22430 [Phytophthora nicotianae INRA-310]ETI52174.1 hypothetical protein F443_04623 [Phytophthora nicotianae P1569]ETO80936.1 hypothetical protein F444_04658 [Phytophthora nicotianae P1976]ETP21987.1 hypothetical protein F441_04602 [Phytophthora nicotianae CJ01A1]ETP49894.1 hypothetical protein F442_04672 [Phytophthora nicotianae P10297]ETN12907.1 hypothetical protein PPTG_22430 [Phytophthora nicotianae INRA-310]